jgi:polar amino acid transport system substrate-binding protein
MKIRASLVVSGVVLLLTGCGGGTSTSGGKASVSPPPNSALFEAGTLTIGSDVSYPPQEFFKEGTREAQGFDIDIGKALADKMGLKFKVVNNSFDSIIPGLTSKHFDIIISAMTIKPERQQVIDFIPYFSAGESFVVPKSSTKNLTQLSDLCGLKVAAEKGTAEEDEAKGLNAAGQPCASNKVTVHAYDVDTTALAELAKGTDDVHFTDSPVAGYEVKRNSNIKISGGVIEVAPEGIGMRKNDSSVENPVRNAFKAIENDGTYDNILKKWGLQDGDIRKA